MTLMNLLLLLLLLARKWEAQLIRDELVWKSNHL